MAKRSTVRISKKVVDSLLPGEAVFDAEIKGFFVQGNALSKSYRLKTKILGRQVMLTIGTHGSPWTPDQARHKALILQAEVQKGSDPRKKQVQVQNPVTVAGLCADYIVRHAIPLKKASSVATDRKNIVNHITPLIGKLRVSEVTAVEIELFKIAVFSGKTKPAEPDQQRKRQGGGLIVRGGPGVANRCLTLLSKMFNLAENWGHRSRGSNPVKGVTRYKETPKERFLSSGEMSRLVQSINSSEASRSESDAAIAAIRLLILTGARLSEILTLRWEHVDLSAQRLRLPDSKTGAKHIVLSKDAVAVIERLYRDPTNPFVIVGRRKGRRLIDLQHPWQRIRAAADLQDVRIHDLRHTFASLAVMSGVPISTVGKLLGHAKAETTMRYAHFSQDHLQAAADQAALAIHAASQPGRDVRATRCNRQGLPTFCK